MSDFYDLPESQEPEESEPIPRRQRPRVSRNSHVRMVSTPVDLGERRRERRKARRPKDLPPTVTPRGSGLRVYISTRWFSALIVVTLSVVLGLFLTRDVFFIDAVYVGGTRYLTAPDIYGRTGVGGRHIFWVDPAEIESRLEQDPAIANAQVEIGWPPYLVQITITEREPALIWEQADYRVWVDVRGRIMFLRQDLPSLIRVVVENPSKSLTRGPCPLQGTDQLLSPENCIDPGIVAGALQFKAIYPTVQELVYDPAKGLGYHDGNGWVLWFGDGTDIPTKMAVYNEIVRKVFQEQGRRFVEVNVSDPDAPYYSLAPGVRR